ncbi:MAG: GNAT family N-acetyltransferase [Actinomycetota bacterium]|nr:GNAT family N-acetyltransferase [Actinomycetota bacterium]
MPDPTRHHYTIDLTDWVDADPEEALQFRSPTKDDAEALAKLMLDAYQGTIDFDDETIVEARQEVGSFFDHPAADLDNSRVATHDGDITSACLVMTARDTGHPFIGYVMTDPAHKGQGVGTATLRSSLRSLAGGTLKDVGAFITEGNTPSEAMFRTVGAVQRPTLVFHIAEQTAWEARSDSYTPATFDDEGFIHCSTTDQLEGVARVFYAGRDDLVLLTIAAVEVGSMLVYEDLYEANERFPHIYGPLPLDAVVETKDYSVP